MVQEKRAKSAKERDAKGEGKRATRQGLPEAAGGAASAAATALSYGATAEDPSTKVNWTRPGPAGKADAAASPSTMSAPSSAMLST